MVAPLSSIKRKISTCKMEGKTIHIEARQRAGEWWITSDAMSFGSASLTAETIRMLSARHQASMLPMDQVDWLESGRSIALRLQDIRRALAGTDLETHVEQLEGIDRARVDDIPQTTPTPIMPAGHIKTHDPIMLEGVAIPIIETVDRLYLEVGALTQAMGYVDRLMMKAFKSRAHQITLARQSGHVIDELGHEWISLAKVGEIVPEQRRARNLERYHRRAALLELTKERLMASIREAVIETTTKPAPQRQKAKQHRHPDPLEACSLLLEESKEARAQRRAMSERIIDIEARLLGLEQALEALKGSRS